jgi:hypothetical protein
MENLSHVDFEERGRQSAAEEKRHAEIKAISAILEELEKLIQLKEEKDLIHKLRTALTIYIGNRQLEEMGCP